VHGLSSGEVEAFAQAFPEANSARRVLKLSGLSPSRHPTWAATDAHGFWSAVSEMAENGAWPGGRHSLFEAALQSFPENPIFNAGAAEASEGEAVTSRHRQSDLAPGRARGVAGPERDREKSTSVSRFDLLTLTNPLESNISTIRHLLDRYFHSDRDLRPKSTRDPSSNLGVLRTGIEASAALEVAVQGADIKVLASSGEYDAALVDNLLRATTGRFVYDRSSLGYACHPTGARFLLLPLAKLTGPAGGRLLVFVEPAQRLIDLGEPLATILTSLWRVMSSANTVEDEMAVLTSLREDFGRVPLQLYRSALVAYRRILDSLTMVFEPVMSLGTITRHVGIESWEALARRDINENRAPLNVLAVAEKWGDEFVIERDKTLAAKAITSYVEAHSESHWGIDGLKPVSINVSVRSLLSGAYERGLAAAVREAGIPPHRITLEISERDPIEPRGDEKDELGVAPIAHFRKRLGELSRKLHVDFAVDDFGVGYATLDRIANLPITQIKVDRAILHHSLALDELDLVMAMANEALHSGIASRGRTVVVEGFDQYSPVSLRDLYAHGIHHVQGYITEGPATSQLRPLNDALRAKIAALVSASE